MEGDTRQRSGWVTFARAGVANLIDAEAGELKREVAAAGAVAS